MQSKEALACLTPDCAGVLMRALVLGGEDGAHRELYSRALPAKPRPDPRPRTTAAVAVPARRGQRKLDASAAPCIPSCIKLIRFDSACVSCFTISLQKHARLLQTHVSCTPDSTFA